ncbi:DUF3991 domain-containing protein [Mesorhizobium sp. INR15]|uniref:DUF3991 domain-containing protein n=1 Tax=Mesorhizobium sp. INR15 TaxID=2654248 RepID=UPI0018965337|nr:DUF3991 domain-containing protein [Mesorhizobium sp. INR15]QPC95917.1 DUF3991 domain-containing protein [Mesorhizobium sp. INR15]
MEKNEVEELRGRVQCAAVLEKAGFAIDLKESTRKAVKYRRGEDMIIVIHDGKGWFDARSDVKGDVFSLVEHLDDIGFAEVLQRVSELIGLVPREAVWTRQPREREPVLGIPGRWRARRKPWRGSMSWRYLHDERGLPETVLRAAIQEDRLREGPRGSMWAAHVDDDGDFERLKPARECVPSKAPNIVLHADLRKVPSEHRLPLIQRYVRERIRSRIRLSSRANRRGRRMVLSPSACQLERRAWPSKKR